MALAKQQVLLVDDEPQILVALEDLLSSDFVVLKAQSGTDALDVMHERPNIAVVITDQRMPQMPGDELVSRINEFHNAQRILVTGYADLSAVVRAVNEGQIFAYVTKPWNEDDLRQKVLKAAEQFRLSQELANEKRLLDDLMNNSPDGIYFKDRNLKFVRANQTVADWHQVGLDDLVGKRLSELQPTADAVRVEEQERQSLQDGKPILDLLTQKTLGAEARWISETKAPIQGLGERPVGLIGISRDITKQLELEQQLVQAQKMEAIGKLAGGVAHDFNNLLMVMQGCGEMIRENMPDDEPRRNDVEELLRAVERASSLTKQLLTFSKKRPIKLVLLNLNEIATEATAMLRRLMPENVSIELALMPEVELMRGDATQVEQVLLNLTINARDAMPNGGKILIRTEVVPADVGSEDGALPQIRLSVADQGHGMSREVMDRIFEPFFSTKEIGKGTGLGLSTVYGIVKQLSGDIRVESEVGKGTTFEVYFPTYRGPAPTAPVFTKSTRPHAGSEVILLVEDDDNVRRVARRMLEQRGYQIMQAASPSEAKQISAQHKGSIDLLLTDVAMPEKDGLSLAAELLAERPNLRVIYMSGYVEEAKGQALNADGIYYLEKPFSQEKLLNMVAQVFGEEQPKAQ